MQKVALITGITGQDGSYLAELLLSKGYEVHGIVRRSSTFNRSRIDHLDLEDNLHYGDMTDIASITRILSLTKPDEIYNLAAQSHVAVSFDTPQYTGQVDALGTLNLLEAVRTLGLKSRIYQASTSELFAGSEDEHPYSEESKMCPKSPYGVAKLYSYNLIRIYRESYGMYCVNGILFNHESERRGENFVTRKITLGIADMIRGLKDHIELGNVTAERDWGHAKDYVEAMWLMLQQDEPEDLCIATGEKYSVRDFVEKAFEIANDLYDKDFSFDKNIVINDKFKRPNEVQTLLGDSTKAREKLGWSPKISFEELIELMIKNDISSF
jgi:GDPmannose 4,6-dehydratase